MYQGKPTINNMKQIKFRLLLIMISVLVTVPAVLFAQGPGFDEDVDDVPVPIDGGVTLVAAAAAGYGLKKLRDSKRK